MSTSLGIPTTIFSGFLGSGKTTIIGHLIDTLQANKQQVVYIKNEIGSENIDTKLLASKGVISKELLNGCICCTLVGPFITAIDGIAENFKPDRIIIEASGAADPSAIAMMVSNHPKLYRDGVISIVDVCNFTGYADLSITARRQAEFTDLIVFNKVELASLETKQAVVGYVRELNEYAPIIEAPHGVVDPTVVFGISSEGLQQLLSTDHPHTDHLHTDGIETFHVTTAGKADSAAVRAFLTALPANYFRVKALFTDTNGATYVAHKVGPRVDILPFSQADAPITGGKFVFIGFSLAATQEKVASECTAVLHS